MEQTDLKSGIYNPKCYFHKDEQFSELKSIIVRFRKGHARDEI